MSKPEEKQIAVTFTAEQVADIKDRCKAMTPETSEAVMKPTQYIMALYLADVARRKVVDGRFVDKAIELAEASA